MIADEIRKRMLAAVKSGDETEKNLLRTALGEIQSAQARTPKTLTEEEAFALLRKLAKSNDETFALTEDAERKTVLKQENAILAEFLTQTLDVDAIVRALEPVVEAIRAAKGDGPAIGIAMKHLKSAGAVVQGKDVSQAVRDLRA